MKEIYLAGGCFWCISDVYYSLNGVVDVVSGFSGGDEENPSYEDVKFQKTGHRETVKIVYDESKIGLSQLLEIYYQSVDPFDDNGQFIDRGHSYTLAIFYKDIREKNYIDDFLRLKQEQAPRKICIAVEKFKKFYSADECHQHFSEKHPEEFENELIESGRKIK